MKKHMESINKLDMPALLKERASLKIDIFATRRGVINGEIQNTQASKSKRRELARVNTLIKMLSDSNNKAPEVADNEVVTKSKKAAPKTTAKESKK